MSTPIRIAQPLRDEIVIGMDRERGFLERLSKESGVPKSTIWRFAKKNATISLENAEKLLPLVIRQERGE